jgi:hypothetical protein
MLKVFLLQIISRSKSSPTQPYFEDELRLNPQTLQDDHLEADESPVTESLWLSPNRFTNQNLQMTI